MNLLILAAFCRVCVVEFETTLFTIASLCFGVWTGDQPLLARSSETPKKRSIESVRYGCIRLWLSVFLCFWRPFKNDSIVQLRLVVCHATNQNRNTSKGQEY